MKKLGKKLFQLSFIVSLASVLSCELTEQAFIEPVPIALEASEVSATSFQANWRFLLGASRYLLEVANDAAFNDILPGYPIPVTDTTFLVTGLSVNQTYFYRIRATRGGVLTPNSQEVIVQTSSLLSPLALDATQITSTSFKANWMPTDGAVEYILELSTDENFSAPSTRTTADTCFTFTDLEPELQYYYRLRATDGASISGVSNSIRATTLKVGTPLPLPAEDISPIHFIATWNRVGGANAYELEVAEDPDFTQLLYGMAAPITVTDTAQEIRLYSVRVAKTHYYRVRARSNFSTSEYSETITVNTQTLGDCRLEEISNPNRSFQIQNVFFTYANDRLESIEWGNTIFADRFRHRIEYQADGKIDRVILADFSELFGETINEIWNYTYDGDVVSQIDVTQANGNAIESKFFEYNDSLQVTRFSRSVELLPGDFVVETDLRYTYASGGWTPIKAVDTRTNAEVWRWIADERISPFVLIDPNLALLMPIVTQSGFASPGIDQDEENRVPFLNVTNLTFVSPPNPANTTSFDYEFGRSEGFSPTRRTGSPTIQETYVYSSNDCGL